MRPPGDDRAAATLDQRGRDLRDLRISITDRCNFRCGYCMPREHFGPDHQFLEHARLLTFDEIDLVARAAVSVGVRKIRLTGGEPLLRRGVDELVGRLSGVESLDLAMTTNGSLLAQQARALADHGLDRVTVSLDALDPERFRQLSDSRVGVDRVLDGIDAALDAGISRVKVNMVVRRGLNDGDILAVAERFRSTPVVARFIEYMDVGGTNAWDRTEVVPSAEVLARIAAVHPVEPLEPLTPGEVASRYRYLDGAGEIGVISSVTQPFCGACTRLRLSADGQLHTCLFTSVGHDLRTMLRAGAEVDDVADLLRGLWTSRSDRYSELRAETPVDLAAPVRRFEMSYLGG